MPASYWLLLVAAVWAGAQNALAGGGSFVTLPSLMLTGLDARAANISSAIALFPGQVSAGLLGRKQAAGVSGLRLRVLVIVSLAGGAVGALLLLLTPASFFARLVPWLVMFATGMFAWGSFFRKAATEQALPNPLRAAVIQFLIAVYGGYYGGGIGFLMMAALSVAGQAFKAAGATKNLLASVINGLAVLIFVFTPGLDWTRIGLLSAGALVGGWGGVWLLRRVNEKVLRIGIIILGSVLTVGLFLRGH